MDDENAPATRKDLHELEERLSEQIRDMQTELPKAFLPFQEQVRTREAALEARGTALELRMGVMEARLGEIEKKLMPYPPAA